MISSDDTIMVKDVVIGVDYALEVLLDMDGEIYLSK